MYQAQLAKAAASTKAFANSTVDMASKNKQSFDTLGYGMVGFGALVVGGLGVANKAAIDFESSFAGVRKTVDGTEPQMQALARGFRDLATELPVNVNELNRIGEAAGQLGIKREAILGFTETVAKLGVTTNLAGEEGASGLAQIANIMRTSQGDFDRMGATIVALGNDGASTEADIVEMSLRIAGAGRQIGLTEAEVLGFANALASVGIRAEAGGSSISRTFIEIATAVDQGGDKLDTFARVAGLTVSDFSKMFEEDAAGATIAFVEGLGKIDEAGGSVFGTLKELGLSEQRVRDALLRASGAGDLFRESIELGSIAWKENLALNKEAAERFKTTASTSQLAKNEVNDLAISVGNITKPMYEFGVTTLGAVASGLNELPGPIKGIAVGFTGLLGAASLAAGGFLLLAPRIAEAKKAAEALGVTAKLTELQTTRLGSSVGLLGKSFGGLLIGYTVVTMLKELRDAGDEAGGFMGVLSDSLRSNPFTVTALAGADFVDIFTDAQYESVSLGDKFRLLGHKIRGSNIEVKGASESMMTLSEGIGSVAGKLLGMATDYEKPTTAIQKLTQALREQRELQNQMAGGFVGLVSSMNAVKDTAMGLTDAQKKVNRLQKAGKEGTDKYKDAQKVLTTAQFDALEAQVNATDAIRSYAKELRESGAPQSKVNDQIREYGKRAGLTRAEVNELIDEVNDYRGELGKVPTAKNTKVTADVSKAKAVIDGFIGALDQKSVTVEVKAQGVGTGVMLHSGGPVPGSGEVPAILQTGEFVVQKNRAREHARLLEGINSGRMPPDYHSGGWVAHPEMMTDFASVTSALEKIAASGPSYAGGGNIVGVGRWLQSVGFRVSGHGAFGGTPTSGHSTGSLHYSDRAIDLNAGPGGASAIERAMIAKYLPAVTKLGPTENLHPFNDPSHYDHWHVAFENGGYLPNGFEGYAKMHKNEVVSPVPVMSQVVRDNSPSRDMLKSAFVDALREVGNVAPVDASHSLFVGVDGVKGFAATVAESNERRRTLLTGRRY